MTNDEIIKKSDEIIKKGNRQLAQCFYSLALWLIGIMLVVPTLEKFKDVHTVSSAMLITGITSGMFLMFFVYKVTYIQNKMIQDKNNYMLNEARKQGSIDARR